MERPAPVRKSHTSTADLLIWPEGAPQESPAGATPPSNRRPHQPSEALRKVVFGGQVTEEEAESLNKRSPEIYGTTLGTVISFVCAVVDLCCCGWRNSLDLRKPCSAPKWKEMTGSGIFAAGGEAEEDESANASATPIRTAPKNYQAISTISHISFSEEESISPKKPTSIAEVAKQRELSGTLLSEDDSKMKKQISDLKSKELSGHDIFAPPEDPRPRNSENGSTSQTPGKNAHVSNFKFGEADEDGMVKTAKKIPTKKFTDLAGNIFKGDETPPGTAEKHLSTAKLKEMTGSDIFADGKAPSRDYLGGIRKPPGGESSIALV
ncbi:uncharacterized protein [Zea mays]|uniref:DUF4057 domain-containing protein n=1 Tax=Zea mays TaxID=4577 RepID=B4FSL4_MAIZE|nr:uncharacterized protein LOC100274081 isoform X1 [Zea mays]ACF85107.1 unknown [Zea mays]ONM25462.1 hypothetical protein ZEAMMB73_Zm00001d006910 [Zea mays]|eukprot:XP_008667575.1 uncharacterized protein LOC100274081 isoform X1 [Zea mays]